LTATIPLKVTSLFREVPTFGYVLRKYSFEILYPSTLDWPLKKFINQNQTRLLILLM